MLEKPIVDISKANGDIYHMVDLCREALINTGIRLNQKKDYQKAIESMEAEIRDSKAYIRSLAILASYCKILKKD